MMRLFPISLAIAGSAIALSHSAHAQDLNQAIERCRAIGSDLQRLSCYDSLAKGPLKAAVPDSPTPAATNIPVAPARALADGGGTGRWMHRQSRDGLDNSVSEALMLPASSANVGIIGRPGIKEAPALVIRCKHNQAAIFVAFDLPVTTSDPRVPVQFRIDQTGPLNGVWGRSENDQGIGLWSNAPALELIRALAGRHDFFVRATPPGKGTSEAEFDVTGLNNAIAPLRAACGW